MEFKKIEDLYSRDGKKVPAYLFLPEGPLGGAALCHGYGGSKEQMLGLGARVAEVGFVALCFDLRGHGENPASLDGRMLDDFEAAIAYLRRYGSVVAIGHSLGGRLALLSSADLVVAISPAVAVRPSEEGRQMLLHFGSTTVKTSYPAQILELLKELPMVKEAYDRPPLLIYAKGDVPTLIEGILKLKENLPGAELFEITTHQHAEAPLSRTLLSYLPRWFNHAGLKTNIELLERIPRWLREQFRRAGRGSG